MQFTVHFANFDVKCHQLAVSLDADNEENGHAKVIKS